MDFLQHFLLGQPIEDNGQDSGGVMLATTRDFGGGTLIAGLRRGACAEQPAPVPDAVRRPTARPRRTRSARPAASTTTTVDSGVVAAYAELAPSARAALVAGGGTSPRARALRLRQPHDRRKHGRERRALPRRLPLRTAGRSLGRFHELGAAHRARVEPGGSADGVPVPRARVPRAGGDRALPAATPAVGRGARFRDGRCRRARVALARRKPRRSTSPCSTWTRAT